MCLSRETMQKVWNDVVANSAKLKACHCHEFEPVKVEGRKLVRHYICKHCKGKLDSINYYWYTEGRKHGEQKAAEGNGG